LGATWPGWDGRSQPEPDGDHDLVATVVDFQLHELALVAAREALSGIEVPDRARAALVFGTCFGHGFEEFCGVTERIAAGLAITGPLVTISTACSSSTNAIGLARDLLLSGDADIVVAGGADVLLREAFAGFSALGVLSNAPCAPFSDPPGTILGEGAGFVVLQRANGADRRRAWASIRGYGLSSDGFHETTPDPTGSGIARAIRGALRDAGWHAGDVDYVSAHATGTANNDRIEWSVIEEEIGTPAVSGTKGHIGHTQGAAGTLELVLALLCHREKHVPPTLHFRGPRAGCPADPIAGTTPRPMSVSRGLKLSAAFGGANAVLAYSCDTDAAPETQTRAPVVVGGVGVIGPLGALGIVDVLELEERKSLGASCNVDLEPFGVDARRLDRSARMLTGAAALSLRDRVQLDRTGLFVAAVRMPADSARRCTKSIKQRGIAGTSASAFARMSVNAPTGACSQALGLLGPTSTLSSGRGSGLLAIALAAEWLASRDDATRIIAGGVDEDRGVPEETEGAACLSLVRTLAPESGSVVVSGSAIAGQGAILDAVERAMNGIRPVDGVITDGELALESWLAPDATLGAIDDTRIWAAADATRSCVLAAIAVGHLAKGHARSILVASGRGPTSVAIVFERVP
jgi:3-oxoacyl-[acyl-carrier-protein] synthase II